MCDLNLSVVLVFFFFFQAEDGIRDLTVTGVQTCALPISARWPRSPCSCSPWPHRWAGRAPGSRRPRSSTGSPWASEPSSGARCPTGSARSEEHTSELQSQSNLVCRLLLEKKKKKHDISHY